ncbi:NPXTG-anchored protein [uncultured Ruminococcus sp.]|uniref:NPXTG-anchored protein n=1 Tax=uncultured Ruminococcus sp. TaxID=165186 RepID=UPI0025E00F20|nr:NPXTG-anchored protein [uncultured Ruminococcus sp.]
MMIKKLAAGLSAAVLAATMMSVSVSAAKLGDVVHPSEEDTKMNDSYYSIGAMGFYMGQDWSWNQGDWVGIDDTGKIAVEYKISAVIADKTMSGKGTLGDMGVMVANLPEGIYPVDVKISDAKFVAEDGTTTVFDSLNSITSMDEDSEGGIRIHIRPTDEVDEETGEVTKKACSEVAGWEKEGAFNGGTLSMTLDFGVAAAEGGESKTDTSKAESKSDTSSSKAETVTSKKDADSSKADAGKTTAVNNASSKASDDTSKSPETGATVGGTLAVIALAGTVVIISKKRK